MPDADDVAINAVYSGVGSDIDIPLFKALFKIIHEAHPAATSFGYDDGHATGDYFEIKGVKLWYDSVQNKICWKNDAGTFRFKSGSMANFFKDCSIFTYINLSGIDTSLVTNMSGMFRGCEGLTEIVLDSEKVTDSEDPRYGKFVHFNTANVTDMSYMFCSATVDVEPPSAMSLATLDVSGLDTSNVTNMSHMFYMCWQLSELDVSGFRTSNVTDMSCMFSCYNYGTRLCPGHLTEIDMRNWDFTNVTTVAKMFDRQEQMKEGFLFPETTNFASLTTMWYMFSQCLALTPDVFSDIVATWTFENHAGYPNSIYGDTSSFFGNYNDNNNSNYTLTDARNYIFRDKMTQGGSAKFKQRETCTTKDGHQLWIGKGNKGRHGKLTTQETVH
jgi:surface protein